MPASGEDRGLNRGHKMTLLVLLVTAAALGSVLGEQLPTAESELETHDPENSAMDAGAEEVQLPNSGEEAWPVEAVGDENHEGRRINLTTGGPVREKAGLSKPSITAGPGSNSKHEVELSTLTMAVPLVLLLVVVGLIAVVLVRRRQKSQFNSLHKAKDEELFRDNGEKIPMPKFEEDVPSVLELEMEDLDKWISKDSVGSGLDSRHEN
ncbi:transmembrane protein 154 isoform X1 [Brienomyrus brachyistius]|uniref:transmembrane protein 154 isoform X1 n=1 Tax=Brienomyrus brachyistius TaxID=42636 RepID=UPI0020B26483|nr:transmembrane protein 154 isoform X1 [Brienomyrus brachyistius]XP_048855727.1 transmembrane protein 154 isoform X1 [Brienomyrus brachyistius]